ncbi:hypothetical protein, partial [Metapseudomonas otitidis]|uniref:hypothetical protein n=1 Tax=Metapseudomonas otitidis TaxID=319939 RepID=UPI001F0EE608
TNARVRGYCGMKMENFLWWVLPLTSRAWATNQWAVVEAVAASGVPLTSFQVVPPRPPVADS